jgi:hypothetical protein
MWTLLGTCWDTVEQEPFVYFIGVFDDLDLAIQTRENIVKEKNAKRSDYMIKEIIMNKTYPYDWICAEGDDL